MSFNNTINPLSTKDLKDYFNTNVEVIEQEALYIKKIYGEDTLANKFANNVLQFINKNSILNE